MHAAPLAAVLLAVSAAFAGAENCAVPMTDGPGEPALAFDAASAACRAASSLLADVAKLRTAAGFTAQGLSFSVDPDSTSVNGYYASNGVWITLAYLNDASLGRAARLATLAHEIGHAVQDRDSQIAWSNEPSGAYAKRGGNPDPEAFAASSEGKEHHARSRKLEAHADAIGQELLLRAGFPSDLFARGRANRFGCRGLEGLREEVTTHPADAQRFVNAAMTSGALANDRARKASLALASALGATAAHAGAAPALKPGPYVPAASLDDYDGRGEVKPGRRAAEKLRVPAPPRDAGPVRDNLQFIAGSVVDYWVAEPYKAAVDRLSGENRVAAKVLAACGKPQAAAFDEDFSTLGWTKRIAADLALRAVGARQTPPVYKIVSLGIPG